MTKRKTPRSDDYYEGLEDDPIGLTSAFETIKDPQSVEYDEGDQAIGLTDAFARVRDTGERNWTETGKWHGFDWDSDWDDNSYSSEDHDGETSVGSEDIGSKPATAEDASPSMGEVPTTPEGNEPDSADDMSQAESGEQAVAEEKDGQPDSLPAATSDTASETSAFAETHEINVAKDLAHASAAAAHSAGEKRGRHAAYSKELSPRMKRSRRIRKALIALIVLLVALAAVLGTFAYHTLQEGQNEAEHQAQEQLETTKETATETEADDAIETATQHADVPNLTSLLGKSSNTAIKKLKRGAIVSSNQKVKDKSSAIKRNLTVALADEPADSKTGTPSVYLGLNKKGKIIQAGYSASASALGFGSLSFADAISNEHVIEKTLAKIGVDVKEGSAKLPKNRAKYATYASDKTTVVKERCSFDGDVDIDGVPCTWSAVLSYDYTTQVITGDLSDTVRVIYVYITQK